MLVPPSPLLVGTPPSPCSDLLGSPGRCAPRVREVVGGFGGVPGGSRGSAGAGDGSPQGRGGSLCVLLLGRGAPGPQRCRGLVGRCSPPPQTLCRSVLGRG